MASYPPAGFYFAVRFSDREVGQDTSFLEVSGIGSEVETMSYAEGGENRFAYTLPKAIKHSPLTLKRGIADFSSPLVKWCRDTLEGGLSSQIELRELSVVLLDEKSDPLRRWDFSGVWPQSWNIDPFQADKNSVAIEKIVLAYTSIKRAA
jgi:phage tail-like protein